MPARQIVASATEWQARCSVPHGASCSTGERMANAGEDDLSGPTIMVMGGEPAASAKSAAGDARAQSSANDTRSSGSGTAQTGGGGGGGRRRGSDRMKRKLPKGISLAEQVGLCETRWVTDTLKVASGEVEPHEVSLVGIGDEPHRHAALPCQALPVSLQS